MYIPPHFARTDPDAIAALVDAHPLAAVVAVTPDGPVVNHLPLLRDGAGFAGHVARANPLHALVSPEMPVVAVFRAVEGYVSPNWYPSKAATHRAVPTWNYDVVHVHGRLRFSHAERDRRRVVSLLTTRHERRVNGPAGWRMGDAPPDYMRRMLDGIVALHLTVERIEAKAKLSQNRDAADAASVADRFEAAGDTGMATAIRAAVSPAP